MNCGISWKWKTRKSGSRSNYTFTLSHAFCPQNSRMSYGVEGTMQRYFWSIIIGRNTLFLFSFPLQIFMCERPPWAYFSLTFAFTKLCEVKPSESSITAIWREKMLSRDHPIFPLVPGEHMPLFTILKLETLSLRKRHSATVSLDMDGHFIASSSLSLDWPL